MIETKLGSQKIYVTQESYSKVKILLLFISELKRNSVTIVINYE